MPGGFVCSGSMKGESKDDVRKTIVGKRPISSLFSKKQRAFYADQEALELVHGVVPAASLGLLPGRVAEPDPQVGVPDEGRHGPAKPPWLRRVVEQSGPREAGAARLAALRRLRRRRAPRGQLGQVLGAAHRAALAMICWTSGWW